MSVSLPEITALSREVIQQHRQELDVVSVTTGGDSERVEVMIDILGCHEGPCRFTVNVSRADAEQFGKEFRLKLREALLKHSAEL